MPRTAQTDPIYSIMYVCVSMTCMCVYECVCVCVCVCVHVCLSVQRDGVWCLSMCGPSVCGGYRGRSVGRLTAYRPSSWCASGWGGAGQQGNRAVAIGQPLLPRPSPTPRTLPNSRE